MSDETLYRWVKAGERQPQGGKIYPVKGLFEHNLESVQEMHSVYIRLNYRKYKNLEWLEEINPNPSTELKAEEKLQELNSAPKTNENI